MNYFDNEFNYLDAIINVYDHGIDRKDRTGTGTRSMFGVNMIFNEIGNYFPLLTTKEIKYDSVLSELLWMIEGSTDERRLAEIRYGKPRDQLADKKTIWTANAHADYWVDKCLKKSEGDLGSIYGKQWRDFNGVDQITQLIDNIKKDPYSRRHILTTWNPSDMNLMALPPCHVMVQFYIANNEISCLMYQRSADLFLGSPFNIAFYSTLLMMVAQVTKYEPKTLVYNIGDAHIYHNHFKAVEEQLNRKPHYPPILTVDQTINNLLDFKMDSFKINCYQYHPSIKAPMAV
jgi:thymidylate synthase